MPCPNPTYLSSPSRIITGSMSFGYRRTAAFDHGGDRACSPGSIGQVFASDEAVAWVLIREAPGEPVRVIEAIAAVLANRFQHNPHAPLNGRLSTLCAHGGIEGSTGLDAPLTYGDDDDRRLAMYRRIARRARAGALADPTGGAVAYHPVGLNPDWIDGQTPCAWVGRFLFYREPDDLGHAPNPLRGSVAAQQSHAG